LAFDACALCAFNLRPLVVRAFAPSIISYLTKGTHHNVITCSLQLVGTRKRSEPWKKCFARSGTRIETMKKYFLKTG
jgi:hypothetical protein